MSCEEINDNEMNYFTKINIFGNDGVGKTTLISCLEHFYDNNFVLKNNSFEGSSKKDSFNNSPSIVEEIKRFKCKINEKEEIYFNIYETNLNRYNIIQMNLDTLLIQTKCIIIMWDNNDPDTFENVPKLVETIESGIKNMKFRNVPIFLIQNKSDLEMNDSKRSKKSMKSNNGENITKTIENFKKEYSNINHKKMSLYDNEDFGNLLLKIYGEIKDNPDNKNNNEVIDLVKYKYPFINEDQNLIDDEITITLLGNLATGKTSFIHNLKNENILDIKATIAIESFTMVGEIDNEKITINILDTMGQEKYKSLRKDVYKKADGFLIFFDVTNKESFNEIDNFYNEIENNSDSKEIILLGNKIDENEKRIVKKQDAKDKAEKLKINYYEICCLNGINIIEVLNEITLNSYNRFKRKNDENFQNLPNKRIIIERNDCFSCSFCGK